MKIQLKGISQSRATAEAQLKVNASDFEVIASVRMDVTRGAGDDHQLQTKAGDLLHLEFEDGGEWIVAVEDVDELMSPLPGQGKRTGTITLPKRIESRDETGERGLIKAAIIKIATLLRPKVVGHLTGAAAREIAERLDRKMVAAPALTAVDAEFTLHSIQAATIKPAEGTYLLLLHGTANHTTGSFGDLKTNGWGNIFQQYNGRTLALEHHTLAVSPLQNALDFLKAVPENMHIDILSQSRGGLVADVLARCDSRNATIGFTADEIAIMRKEDKVSADLMEKINEQAHRKKLQVGKVIRVSSPSRGTSLMRERLDHFLNAVLNAVQLAVGPNPIYIAIKTFLLEVISKRADSRYMPGLAALKPGSVFEKVVSNPSSMVKSQLIVIAGDAEVGNSIKQSLLVILTNLYYWQSNDFVVDTSSMTEGALREGGYYHFTSTTSLTNHFSYFRNKDSLEVLMTAIAGFDPGKLPAGVAYAGRSEERGIILKKWSMSEKYWDHVTGQKPIVVLLPGIMGSVLRSGDNMIWVDMPAISKGEIARSLSAGAPNVKASGLINEFYGAFVAELLHTHDVVTFPYDWRLSVADAAADLKKRLGELIDNYNQPVRIVAHSMGGVVVKQLMRSDQAFWSTYINRPESRLVMLGTPWMGSYLIMEVLTGHSRRVRQLALIDFKNSRQELLKIFNNYPGVYDLLALDGREFETPQFWAALQDAVDDEFVLPPQPRLTAFQQYKKTSMAANLDLTNCWYVAGKADETVFDYTIDKRFFKTTIKYLATSEGDGSVTWATGIPNGLNPDNLYFCLTEHGELANDPKNFDGIIDLIRFGKTTKLLKERPTYRAAPVVKVADESLPPVRNEEDLRKALFDISVKKTALAPARPELHVTVVNADLREARYPVMAGHFEGDPIINAEATIDRNMKGRLSERRNLGAYPGQIGENGIFVSAESRPSMAIIAGLGEPGRLTSYALARSIEKAVIELAIFYRDQQNGSTPASGTDQSQRTARGITSMLIATDYGRLPLRESVKAIISGVTNANHVILNSAPGLEPITRLEFIDYYEEMAAQTYLALNDLSKADSRLNLRIGPKIEQRMGARKLRAMNNVRAWWHQFTTRSIINESNELKGLEFSSSAGLARVETRSVYIGIKQVKLLLEQLSVNDRWDARLSKTLFELLIPNEFKEVIRNQNHIAWKFDMESAAFPWELFHDNQYGSDPTFVNSGMIRQLRTSQFDLNPRFVNNQKALVIGDPIYDDPGLPQLPGAKREAELVADQLRRNSLEVTSLIGSRSSEIMKTMFNEQLRFMHFAGHGLYDPANDTSGIAIGDGITLSPQMFDQLPYTPEFVFINCCFSGTINAADDRYYKLRYKLAANIGVQLIRKGVKAVVVTGWAVDDGAAETFATTFYDHMLEGYRFGAAVQQARKRSYHQHPDTFTWGAYQCYGDPFYSFKATGHRGEEEEDYLLPHQAQQDLDDLWHDAKMGEVETAAVLQRLEEITAKAVRSGLSEAGITEKAAFIYLELDHREQAQAQLEALLTHDNAGYSVKAVELYYYLRARHAKSVKELSDIIKDTENLLHIGKTRERHCVLGYVHQKAALAGSGKTAVAHLQKMYDHYAQACGQTEGTPPAKQSEALLSKVLAALALEQAGQAKEWDDLKTDLKAYRQMESSLSDQLRQHGSVELWLAQARVSLVLYLFDKKVGQQQPANIASCYRQAFTSYHNARKISEELDYYYEFLRDLPLTGKPATEKWKTLQPVVVLLEQLRGKE